MQIVRGIPLVIGTTAERSALTPPEGYLFSDVDTDSLWQFNGTSWQEIVPGIGDKYVRATWFTSISATSGGAGSIELPTGASCEFVFDDWPDGIDAVVCGLDINSRPNEEAIYTAGGTLVYVPASGGLSGDGSYSLSGTPVSLPCAFVFRYRCKFRDYDSAYSLRGVDFEDGLNPEDVIGTANQIAVTNNLDKTITLSIPDPAILGDIELSSGKSLYLPDTTTDASGILFKNGSPFIHNFHHSTGDTAVPEGNNLFLGLNVGNTTMGETATQTYQASRDFFMGYNVAPNITTAFQCVGIGYEALLSLTSGYFDTAVGEEAFDSLTYGHGNTGTGKSVGEDLTIGNYNTFAGAETGGGIVNGNYNSIFGAQVSGLASDLSNTVIIADGQGNKRIYVDNNGQCGIGTIPSDFFHVYKSSAQGGIRIEVDDGYSPFFQLYSGTDYWRFSHDGSDNTFRMQYNGSTKWRLDQYGNMAVGTYLDPGTNAQKVLYFYNGTTPSSSPVDMWQMWAADQTTGNSCPHVLTENGSLLTLYQLSHVADASISHAVSDFATTNAALDAIGATVNSVLVTLESLGFHATS